MLIDQSIARIRAYRHFQGWSILRLAKEAGLNEATIRGLDDPDWGPTTKTLRALETIIPDSFDVQVDGGGHADDAPVKGAA